MVRAAFLECTGDLWLEIASRMTAAEGWQPVYWTGADRMRAGVQKRFPASLFHQNTLAVKGQLPAKGWSSRLPPVDEPLLRRLSDAESMALRMMDRIDPDGSSTYHERLVLYYRHIQWALAVLEELRPNVAVFSAPPHLVYDYVFYRLCRDQGVRTVLFTETAVNGIVLSSATFEDQHVPLRDHYRRLLTAGNAPRLSQSSREYVKRFQGDYASAIPGYVKELLDYQPRGRQLTAAEGGPTSSSCQPRRRALSWKSLAAAVRGASSPRKRLGALVKRFRRNSDRRQDRQEASRQAAVHESFQQLKAMLRETGRVDARSLQQALQWTIRIYQAIETEYPVQLLADQPDPETYLKHHGVPAHRSELTYFEYWLFRAFGLRKKRALEKTYRGLQQPIEPATDYVYVPLHYQPEASTSPLGGYYVDQLLMIELLSKLLPRKWRLYVRENPFQFDKKGSGDQTRAFDFYSRLADLHNVRIMSLNVSPFELIDGARAVATITGTSGWEALLRGRPVLLFGQAWYRDCDGALPAGSAEQCSAALNKIVKGLRPNAAKVHKFLQALEETGFHGYTIPDLSSASGVTPQENIEGFVRALRCRESAEAA